MKKSKNSLKQINDNNLSFINLKFYLGFFFIFVIPMILTLIGLAYIIGVLYSIHWLLASGIGFVFVFIFYFIMYKWLTWIIDRWL